MRFRFVAGGSISHNPPEELVYVSNPVVAKWYTGTTGWRRGVHFLNLYLSKTKFGGRNLHAVRIHKLKAGHGPTILYFAELLAEILCAFKPFRGAAGIVPIPSKDRPKEGDARYALVREIARRCPNLASGAGLLYRRRHLQKWKRVGHRRFRMVYSAETHRESLAVRAGHPAYRSMKGKNVILFDDVATTGGSMRGAAARLMERGMTPVMFSLGMAAWNLRPGLQVWIEGVPAGTVTRRLKKRQ